MLAESPNVMNNDIRAMVEARLAEARKNGAPGGATIGDELRAALAKKDNALQELLGDNALGIIKEYNKAMGDLTEAINSFLKGGSGNGNPAVASELRELGEQRQLSESFRKWGVTGSVGKQLHYQSSKANDDLGFGVSPTMPGYSIFSDPHLMASIMQIASDSHVKIDKSSYNGKEPNVLNGRLGVDHISVSGRDADIRAFSHAIDLLTSKLHEGFAVDVNVLTDQRGRVSGARASPRITAPGMGRQ